MSAEANPRLLPLIRGTAMMANRAFLEREFGAQAFEQVLRGMPAEHYQSLAGIPIAHEWYPLRAMMAFINEASRVFSCRYYHERIGAFQAEYDLNFVHRFLLKFTSPLWVIDRGGRVWRDYFNSGHWEIVKGEKPRTLTGTLHDFAFVDGNHCRIINAFLERIGQLTGASATRVVHTKCRAAGAPACIFEGKW